MLIDQSLVDGLARGAAHGLTYGFATRLMSWILSGRKKGQEPKVKNPAIVKRVSLDDLGEGIPYGYDLFSENDGQVVRVAADEIPVSLEPGDSLLLVKQGEFWVPTALDDGSTMNVAVEFDGEGGFEELLHDMADEIDAGSIGVMLSGGLCSLAEALIVKRSKGKVANLDDLEQLVSQADEHLKQKGLRCKAVRMKEDPELPSDTEQLAGSEDFKWLKEKVANAKSQSEWQEIVGSLQEMHVPLDSPAMAKLERLRAEVIQQSLDPDAAVSQLAKLTEEAFERAEIPVDELQRWYNVASRMDLDDDFGDQNAPQVKPAGLAQEKRPGTFWVWNRSEVDRRLRHYLKRTVQRLHLACEKSLERNSDLNVLRGLKPLHDALGLLKELLDTSPLPSKRFLNVRLNRHVSKELVRNLETSVKSVEQLTTHVDALLKQTTFNDQWRSELDQCLRDVDQLAQSVRDRRHVDVG